MKLGDQVTQTETFFRAFPKSPARIGVILGFPQGAFVRVKWAGLITPQTMSKAFLRPVRIIRVEEINT